MALVSAGLLVPLDVAPSLAQNVITPSAAMAPREQREQLAPAVMQAQATANQLAFDESLKRLSQVEQSEPAEALAQYKRFFSERALSPELGVQIGLKIARLRLAMGDEAGALQTCEVIGAKYADEPTAALFALEKARVLLGQKQLAPASEEVNEAMPEWVALGPSRYREISDVLLQLVQANLDSGDADGKERARALCVDLEEVYLRWTKKDAVDHLWQRFEALQVDYEKAGDEKRAEELLPKVGDALLKMPVKSGYVEGAALSLETARWLTGQGRYEQAALFYAHVPNFRDEWHTALAICDQATTLINQGKNEEARRLLNMPVDGQGANQIRVALLFLKARSYYKTGDFKIAINYAQQIIDQAAAMEISPAEAMAIQNWSLRWSKAPILTTKQKLRLVIMLQEQSEKPVTSHFFVRTLHDVPLVATVSDERMQIRVTGNKKENDYFAQTDLALEVPRSLSQSVNATITVSSPQFPDYQAKILLEVQVPK